MPSVADQLAQAQDKLPTTWSRQAALDWRVHLNPWECLPADTIYAIRHRERHARDALQTLAEAFGQSCPMPTRQACTHTLSSLALPKSMDLIFLLRGWIASLFLVFEIAASLVECTGRGIHSQHRL